MKKNILIGITSGIAAFKMIDLIKQFGNRGHHVEVMMTDAAIKMIPVSKIEKNVGKKVHFELFEKNFDYKSVLEKKSVEHIALADWADIVVIAPATANTIAKIASGIADNFLTTTILATKAPILIAPSMNVHMWENPIVQENISRLQGRNIHILYPESGNLACGYTGIGRLPEIQKIESETLSLLQNTTRLKGKKIIVTSGGTCEPIDPVRMITNKSTGKMGVALATACSESGAEVLLLRGLNSMSTSYPLKGLEYESGKDLEILIKQNIAGYDMIVHNAAVSDYALKKKYSKKLDSKHPLTLHLETTTKILSQIKKWNKNIVLVGFKAVYNESYENAVKIGNEKLKESNSDYIVVNDVGKKGIGFGSENNEAVVLSKNNPPVHLARSSKIEIARKIIELVFPHS